MTELKSTPLTVVGAGPAGILAAYIAAQEGVEVTLIDDNPLPGGQYYRQSPPEFTIPDIVARHSGHPEAAALFTKLDHPRIRTIYNMLVWGVFDGRKLALADCDRSYLLPTDRVVLATGAYDRPLAFPGWTLPGVLGAGAALRMVKTQWLLPGKRVLLAGLGPLQLALADLLLKSGVEVVCVAEAANQFSGWRHLRGFWGNWDQLREAYGYVQTLRRHRVQILFNHAIVEAKGTDKVEAATISRLNRLGAPIPGTERTFEIDTVCLSYGFLPSFQLPVAFGCDLTYNQNLRWHVPYHDDNMESTEPGIFVAGDVTGMGGAVVAKDQGRIAGLMAAHQLGYLDGTTFHQRLASAKTELRRRNRLARALQNIYAFRPGLAYLASADTILCRCEDVTYGTVEKIIAEDVKDLNQVKLHSRAGMGYCQGRMCSPLIAPIIARQTSQSLAVLPPFTVRPPIQPVPLRVLAATDSRVKASG